MTDQQHPITPPPELVNQWLKERLLLDPLPFAHHYLATRAAQWGWDERGANNEAQLQERADQELEACCDQMRRWGFEGTDNLRAARRPKPQTLNSIALQMLGTIEQSEHFIPEITDTIRRALEQLND
jgi:hypothetical protein